jgi:putative ABC transport system permease protein
VRVPNLLYFYRRRLRARLVQELIALVGIAVGVALLFAVQISNTSLNESIVQLTTGLLGKAQVQLAARDPHGFSERAVATVERNAAVRAAAPVLIAQANAVGPRGQRSVMLIGADARLARMGGDLLSSFASNRLVGLHAAVLPEATAKAIGGQFGKDITLELGGQAVRVPVGAIVDHNDVGPLAEAPAIVLPLRYAQQLTDMRGRISRLFVNARQGHERDVEALLHRIAADRLDVAPPNYDSRLFSQAAIPNDQSTSLFAAISTLVGFLFAFNAMLLMARERRNVIAELRMSGFGSVTVAQVLLLDALVLGLLASAAGVALGDQLSRHFFQPAPGYLTLAFPVGTARVVHLQTIAIALAAGVLAVLLATLSPLATLLSDRAIDAVDDGQLGQRDQGRLMHSHWLIAAGVGCIAAATAILIGWPGAAMLGIVLLTASMLLTMPALLRGALRIGDRARRRITSVVPVIAIGEIQSSGSRSVGLAALAAIAVFGSTAIEAAHHDLQHGLNIDARELSAGAAVWVSPTGASNTLATTPFRPTALIPLIGSPDVASVQVYRGGFLNFEGRRVWVMAPPRTSSQPIPPSEIVTGGVGPTTARFRAGGWAVLSEALAKALGVRIGESFRLAAPHPTTFRLAGVTTNLGWTPGTVIVNADDYRRSWGSVDASALLVDFRRGISPLAGKGLVEHLLGPSSGLTVETAHQRELRHQATAREGLARLTQIATLVLIAAAFAMAAAMGGMIWQRRRRLADLKLAGIDNRRLWKAVLLESAILLGIGCSVGAIYGLYGQQLLDRWLRTATGFPVVDSIGVPVALTSFALVTAVALAIAMLPGYLAARVPTDVAFQD